MTKVDKTAEEESVATFSNKDSTPAPTSKEIAKEKLSKLMNEELKLVKGRFRNYETPGGSVDIQVKKYHEKYTPMFKMVMRDNEQYEIPLYVARHLNGTDITAQSVGGKIHTCSYLVNSFAPNPDGSMKQSEQDMRGMPVPIFTNKYIKRYGFESLEFDK